MQDNPIAEITTRQIAMILNDYAAEGKNAMAKLIRSTLSDIFREAIAEGHITVNPVTATRTAKFEVKRTRLMLDEFRAIYRAAEALSPWVNLAMDLAVLTGQRISDLCAMSWEDVREGYLYVEQKKTGAKLAIPVALRLDALDVSLEGILAKCRNLSGGKTLFHRLQVRHFHPQQYRVISGKRASCPGLVSLASRRAFMSYEVCQHDCTINRLERTLRSIFWGISRVS